MTSSQLIEVIQAAVFTTLKIAAPMLIISMLVGLVISILQAATQIHEQTITFVPKLVTIAIVLVVTGSWMMQTMNNFTQYIFNMIAKLN